MIYNNKNFLIAGVSKSGFSSAKFLKGRGANIFLFDDTYSENIQELTKTGCNDVSGLNIDKILQDIYCIVKSPGVPAENKLIEKALSRRIPVISETELAYYNYKGTCIAVTGTNGKSTVTTLIDYIINCSGRKSFLCGNIGVPFTEFCEQPYNTYACVEISSFQLENCFEFKPHIAVMLNITEDHIDRHHNIKEYINAKKRVFFNQRLTEYAVLNFDCPVTRQLFENVRATVYWFSLNQKVKGAYVENGVLKFCGENIICGNEIFLKGRHNVQNCLAAVCSAKLLDISNTDIAKAISCFKGIAHRLQYAGKAGGVVFYNDSKATNTDSALMAARAMDNKTVMLIGGYDKGADFKPFFKELKKYTAIISCVFFGAVRQRLISDAEYSGYKNYTICDKLKDSVYHAYNLCGESGTVLLSPACASFDEFKNFEERGESFLEIVKEIINVKK